MQPKSNARSGMWVAIFKGFLLGLGLLLVFFAGFFVRDLLAPTAPSLVRADPSPSYPLLSEVQDLLETHFLRDLPAQNELEYAAIRGLIGSLNDPYTLFIDPPVARSEFGRVGRAVWGHWRAGAPCRQR